MNKVYVLFCSVLYYHWPIVLKFLRPAMKTYSRRIWNYKLTALTNLGNYCLIIILYPKLRKQPTLTSVLNKLLMHCFLAAEQSFPNKVVTIRPSETPWINCQIEKLIRKRKWFFKIFRTTSNPPYWERYNFCRSRVVTENRNSKKNYFDKLDRLLSTNTTNSKLFWKTAKQVLNLGKSSNSIPTLKLNNE